MRFTVWHKRAPGCRTSMYQANTLADARARLKPYLAKCTDHLWAHPFTVIVTQGARQSDVETIYHHKP